MTPHHQRDDEAPAEQGPYSEPAGDDPAGGGETGSVSVGNYGFPSALWRGIGKRPPPVLSRIRWRSPLRGPWLTSVFGAVLLVALPVVVMTGLLSYIAYGPRFGQAYPVQGVQHPIPGQLMRAVARRAARLYGERLFHLVIVAAALALGAYAISILGVRSLFNSHVWWQSIAVWFAVAVIGHDLILFPLYALADRLLIGPRTPARRRGRTSTRPPAHPPAANYLRLPTLAGALLLMVFPTRNHPTGRTDLPRRHRPHPGSLLDTLAAAHCHVLPHQRRVLHRQNGSSAAEKGSLIKSDPRTAIALFGGATILGLAVGCGGGKSPSSTTTTTPTMTTSSSGTPAPPPAATPGGPAGGAFPGRPIMCYVGLNCGCIPHLTCPGSARRPLTAPPPTPQPTRPGGGPDP